MVGAAGVAGFEDLLSGGQIDGSRRYQEDDFWITELSGDRDNDLLMILADGMGGHRGGAQASSLAVMTFAEVFCQATGGVAARLRVSLDAADSAVGRRAAEDGRYRGMGCTLVACVVTNEEVAHWISVGDSPLWLVRAENDGEGCVIERLNEDHSMKPVLEDLVRVGRLSREEADGGMTHQLRSAVTGSNLAMVDEGGKTSLEVGDRLIIASDGLETLAEAEIRRVCLQSQTASDAVSELLKDVTAAAHPTQDNATVVVYRHTGPAAVSRRLKRLTARTVRMGRGRARGAGATRAGGTRLRNGPSERPQERS